MTFEEAFRRINGRAPSEAEVKEVLALVDVLKKADLDPMLLMYLADVKAKDERARMIRELRAIADKTVHTIRDGLPTNPEWAKAAIWAKTLTRATSLQAAILALTAAGALALGIFIGMRTSNAIDAHANHLTICAHAERRVLGIADYAERKLHSRTLANNIRALHWRDCR